MLKLAILLVITCLVFSACSTKTQDLRIGIISSSINHLPLSFAIDDGAIPKDKYQLIKFTSGWEVQEAMITGSIDVAIMPFTYVWNAASKGYPISTASFFERETDAVVAQPEYHALNDLRGKKIGMLRASTLDVLWRDYADKNGIEFEAVYFRSPNEAIAALDKKEIAAAVLYVPLVNKLEAKYNTLHWFSEDYPFHPCCDLAVNTNNIKHKNKQLSILMEDLQLAVSNMDKDKTKLERYIMTSYGLSADECREALQHTQFRMGLEAEGKEFERRMTDISLAIGYLDRVPADYEVYLLEQGK